MHYESNAEKRMSTNFNNNIAFKNEFLILKSHIEI